MPSSTSMKLGPGPSRGKAEFVHFPRAVKLRLTSIGHSSCLLGWISCVLLNLPPSKMPSPGNIQYCGVPPGERESHHARVVEQRRILKHGFRHSTWLFPSFALASLICTRYLQVTKGIEFKNANFTNGVLTCSWHRGHITEVEKTAFNTKEKAYYLLLATGTLQNDPKSKPSVAT